MEKMSQTQKEGGWDSGGKPPKEGNKPENAERSDKKPPARKEGGTDSGG